MKQCLATNSSKIQKKCLKGPNLGQMEQNRHKNKGFFLPFSKVWVSSFPLNCIR